MPYSFIFFDDYSLKMGLMIWILFFPSIIMGKKAVPTLKRLPTFISR